MSDSAVPGMTAVVALLSDPNGDGSPTDATVLTSVQIVVEATAPSEFQRVDLPPNKVGAPGDRFFVAVFLAAPPLLAKHPIPLDTTLPVADGGWAGVWPGGLGGLNKVAELVPLTSEGLHGDLMLRAVADFGVHPVLGDLDCDGGVGAADLGLLLRAWGPCAACPADLDGSGLVDAADLGLLLASWK